MNLSFNDIKTIVAGKLQGKTDTQIKLDVLQAEVVNHVQGFNPHSSFDEVKSMVSEAFDQLVSDGKLIVDATGAIIDHHI